MLNREIQSDRKNRYDAKLLQSLSREKDRWNNNENQIPIDYACGWAHSTDEGICTLQMLLDKADSDMYENKQLCKKHNLCSHQGTQK